MRAADLVWIVGIGFGATGCIPHLEAELSEWEAPENSWPISEPPDDLVGSGWGVGETPADFRLTDQHGDTVSLWQFYGDVILVDISTMWCAPCQALAKHTEETWHDYQDQGFVYITVLQADVEGGAVDPEDIQVWADTFGITAPIVEDSSTEATGSAIQQGQFPAVLVVGRDMEVVERVNPVEDAAVRAAIERAL